MEWLPVGEGILSLEVDLKREGIRKGDENCTGELCWGVCGV